MHDHSHHSLKPSIQIEQHKHHFTKSEQKIVHYILTNHENIIYDSLTELSENSEVAEATALRFFRKIGFSGFQAFKLAYAHEQTYRQQESALDYVDQIKANMVTAIEESYHLVDQTQLDQAVKLINSSNDIVVFGIGASGIAALDMQNRLMRIGKNIEVITDTHAQIMRATSSKADTVIIAISLTGSTKEIIDNITIAKNKGASIVALTNYSKSPLTKLADIVLLSSAKENPLDRGSLVSKISQLYLIDLICTGITILNSEEAERIKREITENTTNKLF
ncbi:transcriptional regulator, RpiR family [Amphibacillus marinus]|uniref:Transcriptional regulator, RpiR family n=1 Tax=Amphibacillus marinus TaxID=872970 RepID=A0A1H8MKJ4_9BACI|nr:MurR/RpiR family transcriptional regulator [Amphibacillus marinus]SEO17666.1 transcriptional regulator, RpiR family [Amphibacillus marinus]